VIVAFYFLWFRPKKRRARAHRRMLATLRRGSRVAIGGGIIGTIDRMGDVQDVLVDIANGVQVRVMCKAISEVLAAEDRTVPALPRVHRQKDSLAREMTPATEGDPGCDYRRRPDTHAALHSGAFLIADGHS
jgi:preprotein translocase subunit YajC